MVNAASIYGKSGIRFKSFFSWHTASFTLVYLVRIIFICGFTTLYQCMFDSFQTDPGGSSQTPIPIIPTHVTTTII